VQHETDTDTLRVTSYATITKYHADDPAPYEVYEGAPNLILDAGANAVIRLLLGLAQPTYAGAYIGVGSGSTSSAPSMTELVAGTATRLYQACDAGYPRVAPTDTRAAEFRTTYGAGAAAFTWNEWTIANGLAGTNTGDINLNRAVDTAMGTKPSADTWIMLVTLRIP
jgi:hypothetical protein